jgi:hypothetical protein
MALLDATVLWLTKLLRIRYQMKSKPFQYSISCSEIKSGITTGARPG